jgi:subtilisin family serine protease
MKTFTVVLFFVLSICKNVSSSEASTGQSLNYNKRQAYLENAPIGIGAMEAWKIPGGKGENVKIIDIEVGYNDKHKDLNLFYVGYNSHLDINHATAVLGILGAVENNFGITGIAHKAKLGFYGFDAGMKDEVDEEYITSIVNAIRESSKHLEAGDVLVIEQEMVGPAGEYILVEYWNEIFYALKKVTSKGIHCVEASGNGGSNLDDSTYKNAFNLKYRDSGCIVVGAGDPETKERLSFSNYGSRVDAQGHGRNVFTLGYGYYDNIPDLETTDRFNGTSSATPIVAGAIALVSSIAKYNGLIINPLKMRDALRATGTHQGLESLDYRIGSLPNVIELVKYFNLY